MSNKQLIILPKAHSDLRLRAINDSDIENLRNWKNANKQSFFLNKDITTEQQRNWFQSFVQRPDDHMFIVEQNVGGEWKSIGCMGYRKLEDEGCIDGYNIIRAEKIEPASFTMSDAFLSMLAYAASEHAGIPLQVKVLSHNPAISWYEKNGFSIIDRKDDHVLMQLDNNVLKNIDWSTK